MTKQKEAANIISSTMQLYYSVLIDDGTLGAGIKELKPVAAAPGLYDWGYVTGGVSALEVRVLESVCALTMFFLSLVI